MKICVLLLVVAVAFASGQRITTIQLDGVQYFVSRMNPYSPELNYFLAYQYCRSLGLQLASFETKEKADTMTQYLKNAGYTKYDFWTSGNKLGTDMFLWMSSGLPFNATFDYMLRRSGNRAVDVPPGTEPQRVARESGDSGSADGCVAMIAPTLAWDAQDCTRVKDFICEQTRCYYYNYGSIPVSATQGNRRPYLTTTTTSSSITSMTSTSSPKADVDDDEEVETTKEIEDETKTSVENVEETEPSEKEEQTIVEEEVKIENEEEETSNGNTNDLEIEENASTSIENERILEDPVVGRLMTNSPRISGKSSEKKENSKKKNENVEIPKENESIDSSTKDITASIEAAKATRPQDIPDITSLFTDSPMMIRPRKETAFDGLVTHEIRSSSRKISPGKLEHRETSDSIDYENGGFSVMDTETEAPNSALEDSRTIGPYDSVQDDYLNDQPEEESIGINHESSILSSSSSTLPKNDVNKQLKGDDEDLKQQKQHQQQEDEDSSTFLPEAEPEYRYNMKWRSMGKVLDPPSK